mmetsp:Transcript_47525/g.88494  ORF Transcript_47525/g.88494 Transcript_47525/m.88494 type:complete len:95 (+) Transcript_47525:865-1149(+)
MYVCDNQGLCGDVPAGVRLYGDASVCWVAPTTGTLLGSTCPSTAPTEDNSTPVADSGEHPLRENWFRKRDVAREYAFPQKHAWVRKQAKLNNTY